MPSLVVPNGTEQQQRYIDVGGGPSTLPAKYHTVIELPGSSKHGGPKNRRSPTGWKAIFRSRSKSRGNRDDGDSDDKVRNEFMAKTIWGLSMILPFDSSSQNPRST